MMKEIMMTVIEMKMPFLGCLRVVSLSPANNLNGL